MTAAETLPDWAIDLVVRSAVPRDLTPPDVPAGTSRTLSTLSGLPLKVVDSVVARVSRAWCSGHRPVPPAFTVGSYVVTTRPPPGSDKAAQSPADRVVEYAVARRLARENNWREKALVYLMRGREELLVLEHTDEYADAGVQVPGGGVETGEEPEEAALRELAEETGLVVERAPIHLESRLWATGEAPSRIRHYFWVNAPSDTPDRWSHVVSRGAEDHGMLFWLSFRARNDAGLTPGFGWDSALGRLDVMIND